MDLVDFSISLAVFSLFIDTQHIHDNPKTDHFINYIASPERCHSRILKNICPVKKEKNTTDHDLKI